MIFKRKFSQKQFVKGKFRNVILSKVLNNAIVC